MRLSVKEGDLVKVKDALGYNTYMQNLVGYVGVVIGRERAITNGLGGRWFVLIDGRTRQIWEEDLEAIG